MRLEKDILEKDRYVQLLRYIYADNLLFNAELMRLGYARAYPYPPDTKYAELLSQMKQEVNIAGRGLWVR